MNTFWLGQSSCVSFLQATYAQLRRNSPPLASVPNAVGGGYALFAQTDAYELVELMVGACAAGTD